MSTGQGDVAEDKQGDDDTVVLRQLDQLLADAEQTLHDGLARIASQVTEQETIIAQARHRLVVLAREQAVVQTKLRALRVARQDPGSGFGWGIARKAEKRDSILRFAAERDSFTLTQLLDALGGNYDVYKNVLSKSLTQGYLVRPRKNLYKITFAGQQYVKSRLEAFQAGDDEQSQQTPGHRDPPARVR